MDPLIYFWNSRILEGRPRNLLIQDTNSIFSLSGKLQENLKHSWAFYSIKSKAKRIPEFVIYGDTRSRDLNSKVELFKVFFHSVYSKSTTDVNLLATDVVNPNLLSEITTTLYSSRAWGNS